MPVNMNDGGDHTRKRQNHRAHGHCTEQNPRVCGEKQRGEACKPNKNGLSRKGSNAGPVSSLVLLFVEGILSSVAAPPCDLSPPRLSVLDETDDFPRRLGIQEYKKRRAGTPHPLSR
jgi:hypothetical protein